MPKDAAAGERYAPAQMAISTASAVPRRDARAGAARGEALGTTGWAARATYPLEALYHHRVMIWCNGEASLNHGHVDDGFMTYDYRADPILGRALAYWASKRGHRSMPRRRDIDPAEIARLLPNLQLIDVQGDRFRYRLVGTALVEAFGHDYTGKYPDDLFRGTRVDFVCALYRAVRDGRQPMFNRSRYHTTKDVDLIANRLYMPLSEDGLQVSMLLGAFTFEFGAGSFIGAWGSADLDATMSETSLVSLDAPAVSPQALHR